MAAAPGISFIRIKIEDELPNDGQASSEANLKIYTIHPEKIKCEDSSTSENSNSATTESFAHYLKTEADVSVFERNDASEWVQTTTLSDTVAKIKEEPEEKVNVIYELVGSSSNYSDHQIKTSLPVLKRETTSLNRVKIDDKSNVTHVLISPLPSSSNLVKDVNLQSLKSEKDKLASGKHQNYWNNRVENSHPCEINSDREPFKVKACEKVYLNSEAESKVHHDLENLKLVTVSVKLVDLFSSDVRRLGKAHSSNGSCSCVYCNGDYLYNNNSQCLSENPESNGGSSPTLFGNNLNESGRSVGLKVREEKQQSKREKFPRSSREKSALKLDVSINAREKQSDSYVTLHQRIISSNRQTFPADKRFLSCKPCSVTFKYYTGYSKHCIQVHGIEKSFSCSTCPSTFKRIDKLRSHEISHSAGRLFKCTLCSAKFKSDKNLKLHSRTHNGKGPYCCNQCSKTFNSNQHLKRHLVIHSDKRPYSCNQCSATFKSDNHLKCHLVIHSDLKPYSCNECSATFKRSSGLLMHKLYHSDEKPFSCNLCSASFKRKYSLQIHQMFHIEKRSECDSCSVEYNHDNSSIKAQSEKRFKCNTCSAEFKRRYSLILHLKVGHSTERPFSCDLCPAKFKRSYVLSKHKLRHSEERKFKCSQCHLKFKYKTVLRCHMKVHSDKRLFQCNKCSATFKKNFDLINHTMCPSE